MRDLAGATRGNVAITFGLLLPALLIGAGISLDYLRAYGEQAGAPAGLPRPTN